MWESWNLSTIAIWWTGGDREFDDLLVKLVNLVKSENFIKLVNLVKWTFLAGISWYCGINKDSESSTPDNTNVPSEG